MTFFYFCLFSGHKFFLQKILKCKIQNFYNENDSELLSRPKIVDFYILFVLVTQNSICSDD